MTNRKVEATFHGGGKEVQKWADEAMFTAEPSIPEPRVYLLQGTPDPLGSVAAFSAMYTGKVVRDKRDVTDEERRYHLEQMKATKLKAPLEAVNLHFMIEGVTRSFTHQMVRQRTAVYAQESLRFAVKEDAATAIALPPSLAGTQPRDEWLREVDGGGADLGMPVESYPEFNRETDKQKMRLLWDEHNLGTAEFYNIFVNMGMPAEDARGMLPHSITTRLNYATNLRNLQDHAGNRLCTQAQFEWRVVWMNILKAMRNYCTTPRDAAWHPAEGHDPSWCDNWQWNEIANLFRPVCYLTGKCEFEAEFDRKCKIRERVQANASIGRGSEEWDHSYDTNLEGLEANEKGTVHYEAGGDHRVAWIGAISPAEWLTDEGAAR